jgi:hypothetical protein
MPTPTLFCLTFVMLPTLYMLRTMLLYSQLLSPPAGGVAWPEQSATRLGAAPTLPRTD